MKNSIPTATAPSRFPWSIAAAIPVIGLALLATSCKEKDPRTVETDAKGATESTVAKEDGPSCTVGASSARTRMATGGDEEDPTKMRAVEAPEPAPVAGTSRLKAPDPAAPAKADAGAETGDIPGASKAVDFEVKVKERDDATRSELDKILDKAPVNKP